MLGYAHPLFVLATRDPIPETATTARSLALGGAPASSGMADDALASPATLLWGSGTDVVLSGGPFSYSRREPPATPAFLFAQSGGFLARSVLEETTASTSPVLYATVATRHSWWAAAAFLDASDRYEHPFTTTSALVGANQSGHAAVLNVTATGSAGVSESITRVGGALAFAPVNNHLALGVAVYALHLQYRATSTLGETWRGEDFPGGPVDATETEAIAFDGWQPGWVASASARIVPAFSVSARWQHEPQFSSTRTSVRRQVPSSPAPRFPIDASLSAAAQIELPDTVGVTAVVATAHTTFVADAARVSYGDLFQPEARNCGNVFSPLCDGWGWLRTLPANAGIDPLLAGGLVVGTSDAIVVRGGLEQAIPAGRGRVLLRGGLAIVQGHALAEALPDYAPAVPTAPGTGPEFPARENVMTWSGGVAYAWGKTEIGAALAGGGGRTRVLADLRVRVP